MTVTREEIIKTRITLLKQMHQYIIDLGDEFLYEWWISEGVCDEPDEDFFQDVAEDDDCWVEICSLFGKIVNY